MYPVEKEEVNRAAPIQPQRGLAWATVRSLRSIQVPVLISFPSCRMRSTHAENTSAPVAFT